MEFKELIFQSSSEFKERAKEELQSKNPNFQSSSEFKKTLKLIIPFR